MTSYGIAMSVLSRIAAFVVFVALLALSLFLSEEAFNQVLDFRELERIPLSRIAEAVGGETQLHGRARVRNERVKATKTGSECLYFRYTREKKETDSDGNTSWRKVQTVEKSTDFTLVDDSGEIVIRAGNERRRIGWSIAEKYQRTEGNYRHTEWRIDEGDPLTIFGWLSHEPAFAVTFPLKGQYQPIISSFSASSERADIAVGAVLLLWGGLSVLMFACLGLMYGLRVHKTLVFLVVISLSGTMLLLYYGSLSLERDVYEGAQRVDVQRERAEKLISATLSSHSIAFPGWSVPFDLTDERYATLSADEKSKVNAWRRSSYLVRERYLEQISRFPENYYANANRLASPAVVSLPPAEAALVLEQMAEFRTTRVSQSPFLLVALFVVTLAIAWFSFSAIRTKRTQENIPTSKTAGVVYGLTEVKGELVPEDEDNLFTGPLSGRTCTWYHYVVEESSGSGKNKSWRVIKDELKKQPFHCRDDEGQIRIFPGQAECISRHESRERSGNKRYCETRLEPGDELYILGKARLDKTKGDSLVIGHEKGSPYIIANMSEEDVMLRKAFTGMSLMALAVSILFLGALLIGASNGQFSSLDFLTSSLIAPIFLFLVVFILMYNDLVFLRQRCDRNWANIQVSLKKRANLIPRLENVVKEYLAHESSLHEELAKLREARARAESPADLDEYMALEHGSIDRISARIENYPDLKGAQAITDLNTRMIKLENEVALIRAGFNDAVTQYQIRRDTFPDNILARLFGFDALDLLRYEEKAHPLPRVSLG